MSSFPVLYFSWTPPNRILQLQEHLPAGNAISTFSKMCKKSQQWVLCPQAEEYAVVIPKKFKDLDGWADYVDEIIQVIKPTNMMNIVPVGAIVAPAHLVRKNAASGSIDSTLMACKHSCEFRYVLDCILIRLECLIQVYSCEIVDRIVY